MRRRPLLVLATAVAVALPVAAAASAAAPDAAPPEASRAATATTTPGAQGRLLQSLWAAVLTLPVPENPFTGGSPCVEHAGVVSPFGAGDVDISCDVPEGTGVFVNAYSSECSTAEMGTIYGAPYVRGNSGPLRRCVRAVNADLATPVVRVDGVKVGVRRVESPVIAVRMPDEPIVGAAGELVHSVADGWVVGPLDLSPGRHVVRIRVTGSLPDGTTIAIDNRTVIQVVPAS